MSSPIAAADLADWRAAQRIAPYADDGLVAALTTGALASGMRFLGVHRLAETDGAHMRELLRVFAPEAGWRVLDVGCGVGTAAREMLACRPDLDVTLLNVSPWQLSRCPPLRRVCGDFHAVPFCPASFDAAMILYALGHALLPVFFEEMRRILRPGGVLFIWDICADDPAAMIAALGYKPHRKDSVLAAATGFVLDRWMIPSRTDASQFRRLTGDGAYRALFHNVVPIAWRFVHTG